MASLIRGLYEKHNILAHFSDSDIDVCFGQGNCKIMVYGECSGICDSESGEYEFGYTMKNGQKEYYIGSLIYGSIFSAPEVYNCNFKRLMRNSLWSTEITSFTFGQSGKFWCRSASKLKESRA